MTSGDAAHPLLLVLAHGIGEPELTQLRNAGSWSGTLPKAPVRLPDAPVTSVLQAGAAAELRDLGVAVDLSPLLLRPAGRTDATAAELLARRATGPADVTVFEATDVLLQAMAGGPVAAAAATQQLAALLDRLVALLRRGDAPEIWCTGLGSPVAVRTTFDLAAAWHRHVLPPLTNDLRLHGTPAAATVHGDNQRALDIAADLLRRAPFAPHGRVRTLGNGQLQFTAAPGVAFGARPLAARAALPHEANGIACAPLGDLVRTPELDLAQLMARFWLRAAALHVDLAEAVAPQPASAPAPADLLGAVTSRSETVVHDEA